MPIVAELKITMDDAGGVAVEGAIDNKLLAYGLLEVAKESICRHHEQAQRKVQPITTADIAHLRGLDGGRKN